MKRRNGFTLAELLGVITVLGLIAFIVFPNVNKAMKNSKTKLYNQQISLIETNAKRWGVEHTELLPDSGVYYLSLDELIKGGYVSQKEVKDPRNNNPMTGCVAIMFNSEYNQYVYTYEEACGSAASMYNQSDIDNKKNSENNSDDVSNQNETVTPNLDENEI